MNERRIRIDKTNNWTEHWEGEMKKMRFKESIDLKSFTKKEWVTVNRVKKMQKEK